MTDKQDDDQGSLNSAQVPNDLWKKTGWRKIGGVELGKDDNGKPMLLFSRSGIPVSFAELLPPHASESNESIMAPAGAGMSFPAVCLDTLWSLVRQIDVTNQAQIDLLKSSYPGQGIGPMVLGVLLEKIKAGEITDPTMIPVEYRYLLMNFFKKISLVSEIEGFHEMHVFDTVDKNPL